MHCPNCGIQAAAEQKFCRSCGLELREIQQLVARQLSSETVVAPDRTARAAQAAWRLFIGVTLMFTGAALLAFEKRYSLGAFANALGLLLTIGGPLLALYAVLGPVLSAQTPRIFTPLASALPAADTTSKLTPVVDQGASIIEHTTRSLAPVPAKQDEN